MYVKNVGTLVTITKVIKMGGSYEFNKGRNSMLKELWEAGLISDEVVNEYIDVETELKNR